MSFRMISLAALGLVVGLAACTTTRTPAQRIERDPELFRSWSEEVQQRVRAGEVAVGFTEPQVRMALGDPDDISTRTTAEGQTEVWTYRDRSPRVGIGFGASTGGGGSGVGVGVGTSSGGTREARLRVIFADRIVTAVEHAGR